MKKKTIFMQNKAVSIIGLIVLTVLFLASVALILLGILNINNLFAGVILLVPCVIFILFIINGKSTLNLVTFSSSEIIEKTIFGNVIKRKSWAEFTNYDIAILQNIRPQGSYLCLLFNNYKVTTVNYVELNKSENIMILANEKEKVDIVKYFIENIAKT